jgi:hypothetical protein
MRIGVILNGTRLARWQADALATLADEAEFIIYSCETRAPARRKLRHGLYYLLNLLTIRNHQTRGIELPNSLRVVARRSFRAEREGAWQRLGDRFLELVDEDRPAVLIKFGMGLLRIPPRDRLNVPILSYHHGDPARFRGRPAGFYELLDGETTVGQIVQRLSNQLDAGQIVAAAETRAVARSYRATLVEAYRHSPLLLPIAVRNAVEGIAWEPPEWGQVYRLPGNATVLRFAFQRIRDSIIHLLYGLVREKRWKVATVPVPSPLTVEQLLDRLAENDQWRPLATPTGYRFLADPFPHPDGGWLVEAMNSAFGRGEIFHVTKNGQRRISGRAGHFSYPAPVRSDRGWYVVPEMSDWSAASAYPLSDNGMGEPLELRIPGRPRLLDPTPFRHGDVVFLFGNVTSEGASVLRLWVADTLDGEFAEHPASPILISPNGARMAGTPVMIDGRLVRVGQDLRGGYGDGIAVFEVTQIDRSHYAERKTGEFKFAKVRGPHTLNLARGEMAFDYYDDAFSPLAGIRRIKERRAARRIGD